MIDCKQLREEIVRPALRGIQMWSPEAEALVLGTAAQESHMGKYIVQIKGPAKGIFQMEPATHDDIVGNWLRYKPNLKHLVLFVAGANSFHSKWLVSNLLYAAFFCRLHYRRVPSALPAADDIQGLAVYWKRHYNTYLGAGKTSEFVANYRKYVR